MKKVRAPKVPSLQHLARAWDPNPDRIRRTLMALALNGPTFSYQIIYELIGDLMLSKIPYSQVENAIKTRVRQESVRSNFLELLPLVRDQLSGISPAFIHRVAPRYYPIGRGLAVPFAPPFIYGLNGDIHLPWFSFWKSNPLDGKRLSLFITIIDEVLMQDPDLDQSFVTILDFSAAESGGARQISVIPARDIPRLCRSELSAMLSTFVQGYEAACVALQDVESLRDGMKGGDEPFDDDQLNLFE